MDVTDLDDTDLEHAAPMDLTPREATVRRRSGRNRWGGAVLGVLVLVGLGFVLFNGLRNATTYFYNVDEALARRHELVDRRFRIQGNVIEGSEHRNGTELTFTLAYNGKSVVVHHTGDVPDLFKPSIPVVLEGKFTGDVFASDQILVKHDATYDEKNAARVKQAQSDAAANKKRAEASSTTTPGTTTAPTPTTAPAP